MPHDCHLVTKHVGGCDMLTSPCLPRSWKDEQLYRASRLIYACFNTSFCKCNLFYITKDVKDFTLWKPYLFGVLM